MLKIGQFSLLAHVTVKTLRYYDEIGLLKPVLVDRYSGYRYYHNAQLVILGQINSLKRIGFSLEEITVIIQNDTPSHLLAERLIEQRLVLEDELRELQNRIHALDSLYNATLRRNKMETATIKALPEIMAATKRIILGSYDDLFSIAPAMGETMERHGAVCSEPPYCFNLYHDEEYKERDVDMEICEAVVAACQDGDGIIYRTIAAVPQAATILHRGSYENLVNSYAQLNQWMEANGWVPDGKARESFIDGIWNKENPEEWLTEIQIPVKKVD